jgi:hypothetical protein
MPFISIIPFLRGFCCVSLLIHTIVAIIVP